MITCVYFNAFTQGSQTYNGVKVAAQKVRFKLEASTSSYVKAMMASKMNANGFMKKASGEAYVQTGVSSLDQLNAQFMTEDIRRVFRPAGKFEQKHIEAGLDLWYEVTVSGDEDLDLVLFAFEGISEIEIAEPVYQRTLRDVEGSGDLPYVGTAGMEEEILPGPPNDPRYNSMYGLDIINAEDAWGLETGSANVVVAIEDQGVDYNHQDLSGHMWTNSGEVPGNGVDDDNNGYVDDYYGYNFGNNNGNIAIDYHGTHVGGTVAAETNNGVGVAGIAGGSGNNDGVRLMSLSVFGNGSQGGFDEAFVYAADMGAVISQNSWGGGSQSNVLEDAIDYFIANAGGPNAVMDGGLVVFAAGNSNTSSTTNGYPASYSPTVAVASITSNRTKSSFSNYGSWVDISAPGSSILSTYPNNSYNSISGTSMACPHVSGVAALVVSANEGNITASQLRNILESTASDVDSYNASYSGLLGSGIVDAYAALSGGDNPPPPPPAECVEVSSFPYSESFESGLGSWSQVSGDDIDWTRDSGGTPSDGTGPSSAADGTFYLYTEASTSVSPPGSPSKSAILDGPCFDFAQLSTPTVTFSYHMNGANVGSLALEASTNDGSSWSTVWSISGSQGDTWNEASVAINSSDIVKLRFNAVTGSGWSSDITIDDIVVGNGGGTPPPPPPVEYCSSQGGGTYEYIAGVSTGAMNNTSGARAYTDFTAITASVVTGSGITLTPGFTGSSYTEYWTVWIDFNQDGDFTDADEEVFNGNGSSAVTGTLSIPSSASGTTRMRVAMRYNAAPGSSCGDFGDGETEDYTVLVNATSNFAIFSDESDEGSLEPEVSVMEEENIFSVYPNPASNIFHVDLRGAEKAELQVLSLSGSLIKSVSLEKSRSVVDISNLSNGIYMISIMLEDGKLSYTERLIKE